jgi:hypothetical protein
MRRVLIFFGLLCVLLDLADDGGLGRVKFVNLHRWRSAITASHLTLHNHITPLSGKVDNAAGLLSQPFSLAALQLHSRQATAGTAQALKKVMVSLFGSAGGIPL